MKRLMGWRGIALGLLFISQFTERMTWPADYCCALYRVATDLEKSGNLKETPESHGICDRIPKVREVCCLKFIFSQVEGPNFENFLREHAPRPLNSLGITAKLHLGLEKSGKSEGISYCLESGNPVYKIVSHNGLYQKISTPPHGRHWKSCQKCSVSMNENP